MSSKLSLKQNMLWNSVGSVIRLCCNYLITIAVVRFSHGFDAAGGLALAMSISSLVQPVAEFRLRTIQVTDVQNELKTGEYLGLRLVSTTLAFALGIAYSLITCSLQSLPVIVLYLIYSMAVNLIEGFHAIDQKHLRMDFIGISYIIQGVSSLLLFIIALSVTNSLEDAVGVIAIANIMVLFLYDKKKASLLELIKLKLNLNKSIKVLLSLTPIVLAQICSSSVLTIPKQALTASFGAAALGIYSSVASPATIVQMGAGYIYSPLLGEFAARFNEDRRKGLRLLKKVVVYISAATFGLSVLLLVFTRPILAILFGSKIIAYTNLLGMVLICTYFTAFAWFFNDLLLSIRDFRGSFFGNIAASAMSIVLSFILVPQLGMNGVSLTGALSYGLALVFMLAFFVSDYHKMQQRE